MELSKKHLAILARVLANAGIRVRQIANLKWSPVFDARRLYVGREEHG